MPLDLTPDEPEALKKPIFLKIGFIFSLLGLATPLLVYIAAWLIIPRPCCGQRGTPGDGLGLMLIGICGIAWWTLMELFSFALTASGLARKENGRIKVFAVAAAVLSLLLLGLVYAAAAALVNYSSRT